MKLINIIIFYACLVVVGSGGGFVAPAVAADSENCLMCHKYRYMGAVDETGKLRNFNVDADLFLNSIHGKVPCRDCHPYIRKFPHDTVNEKVNCANECHIKPPFAQNHFSHKKIVDIFNNSQHGIKPDDSPELIQAKPDCKYCHQNPSYQKMDVQGLSNEKTLARCRNCHEQKGVTRAYNHIIHRLRHKTTRSAKEIVSLCAKNCHGDTALMQKLNVSKEALEAVETYKESIHAKATLLGSEKSADCISCHASSAIHDILPKDNPKASIFKDNLLKTCKTCHAKRNAHFVQIAVHPRIEKNQTPILFFMEIALQVVLYAVVSGLLGLMFLETARRKKDGIRMQLRAGSSWRRPKHRKPHQTVETRKKDDTVSK